MIEKYKPSLNNSAFTLVELAIVIVIIGLLVGGVLGGQHLVRQAQMQSLIKQIDEYKTATIVFRDKYNCLPGDCLKAHTYFGNACDANADNCNGDGNLVIFDDQSSYEANEIIRFWQHLKLANLIKTSANGVGRPTNIGMAVPNTKFSNVGINIFATNSYIPPSMRGKHYYMVGKVRDAHHLVGGHTNRPFLESSEAYSIDLKIDDGMPDKGNFATYQGGWVTTNLPGCKTGTEPNSIYDTSQEGERCHAMFSAEHF